MARLRVAVAGGSGYMGAELLRVLLQQVTPLHQVGAASTPGPICAVTIHRVAVRAMAVPAVPVRPGDVIELLPQ